MNMVDDATSRTEAIFSAQESLWAAVAVLRKWVKKHGIPKALYTDWKNVYVKEPTPKQELQGEIPLTQFGRMCAKLGIRIIAASSPQAKGRVVFGGPQSPVRHCASGCGRLSYTGAEGVGFRRCVPVGRDPYDQ
jgi:hypothetical protein